MPEPAALSCPPSLEALDRLVSEPSPELVATLASVPGDFLVAGAGGKMGLHLAMMLRRALDQGGAKRRVWAVSRFGERASRVAFERAGVETIAADLLDPTQLDGLPEAGAVFYLAGKKFGTGGSPESLRLYNEEMPARVAVRYARARIVALSTGCVYPFVSPETGGSSEEDEVAPVGEYAQSCLGRERAFLQASASHGTPLSLIRLNYSVDLRYGVLVDVASKILANEPIDLTMGYFNCIWQGDAIRYTLRSLEIAQAAPEAGVLNVTGARLLSVREVATRLGERLGRTVHFQGTESETAWLNKAAKCHRLFGPPAVPEDQLIDWVADWVGSGRPLLGKPTRFEVRDGRY